MNCQKCRRIEIKIVAPKKQYGKDDLRKKWSRHWKNRCCLSFTNRAKVTKRPKKMVEKELMTLHFVIIYSIIAPKNYEKYRWIRQKERKSNFTTLCDSKKRKGRAVKTLYIEPMYNTQRRRAVRANGKKEKESKTWNFMFTQSCWPVSACKVIMKEEQRRTFENKENTWSLKRPIECVLKQNLTSVAFKTF